MSSHSEAEIRDSMVDQLDQIRPGLTAIKKEYCIPADICTQSFVDILAREESSRIVIIEIKKSDATARAAIHELYKYVEAVKKYFGARDAELELIVISTHWTELLVPFSSFVEKMSLKTTGYQLNIYSGLEHFTVSQIELPKLQNGRFIAPWHELHCFSTLQAAENGIKQYEKGMNKIGVHDYVLIILEAEQGFHDKAIKTLNENATKLGIEKFSKEFIPVCNYIIYFAMQVLPEERAFQILKENGNDISETEELLEDTSSKEDRIYLLHIGIQDVRPHISSDCLEIGYPAKIKNKLLEEEKWQIFDIKKYGFFARNLVLTNEQILNEVCGNTGESEQYIKLRCYNEDSANINFLSERIDAILSNNEKWRRDLKYIIEEITESKLDDEILFHIYYPSTGIHMLYNMLFRDHGERYVSCFEIGSESGDIAYVGLLTWDGKGGDRSILDIIEKYYPGGISEFMLTLTWGGTTNEDPNILLDLGITYESFKIDRRSNELFILRSGGWSSIKQEELLGLQDFFRDNQHIIQELGDNVGSLII